MLNDVGYARGHADHEREYGDEYDQQVAQAEQAEPAGSFFPVNVGECQEADDGG